MSDARYAASDVDVDLGRLFGSLARNWLRILLAALAITGLAWVLAGLATPLYRAETRILIEARESVYTRPASTGLGEGDRSLLDQETVASQVEVIGSVDILREVARQLDLASHAEFGAAGETSTLGNLLILAGLKSDPSQASVEERVLRSLQQRLSIHQVSGSRVIVVRFSSPDPELAATVPNAVADAYVAGQEQAKRLTNAGATEWLEPEIEDLRRRVRDAEARVAEYRASSGLLMGQNNSVLPTQALAELSTELTRVRAERTSAEARAATIREALAAGRVEAMPDVLAAPMVQRLRERQAQIEAELADLSAALLENHPRMRALRAQLEETGRQVQAEMRKVLAAVENEAGSARQRESGLVAEVNRLKAASAQAGDDEVELRALEREASAQRALLESYLTRYREAAARSDRNSLPADARVFARATPPHEAYFPKMMPILATAFGGSLLVISVVVLLRELFSGRAMRPAAGSPAWVEEQHFAPAQAPTMEPAMDHETPAAPVAAVEDAPPAAAASTPAAQHAAHPVESAGNPDEEDDQTMAWFKHEEVRPEDKMPGETMPADMMPEELGPEEITVAGIADQLIGEEGGRVVFISPEGDEATAVSVLVAREIADAGLRTVFVDLTWSGAPSAAMLESRRDPGITNLLAGRARFGDIVQGDLYSRCHVIAAGTADPARAMRAADRLPMILDGLHSAYDVVVVECGAAEAQTIDTVADDYTEVLIGAIDPRAPAVAAAADDLEALGYGQVLAVTPTGRAARRLRKRGRFAA